MTKEIPDIYDINSGFQHMYRLAVAQHMTMDMFRKCRILLPRLSCIFFQYIADTIAVHLIMISVHYQGMVFQCSGKLTVDISVYQGTCAFWYRDSPVFIALSMEPYCRASTKEDICQSEVTKFLDPASTVAKEWKAHSVPQSSTGIYIRPVYKLWHLPHW